MGWSSKWGDDPIWQFSNELKLPTWRLPIWYPLWRLSLFDLRLEGHHEKKTFTIRTWKNWHSKPEGLGMIVMIFVSSWVFNFVFLTYEANIPVQKCCQYLEDHLIHTFSPFFFVFFFGGPKIDVRIYATSTFEVYTFGPTFRAENSSLGTHRCSWGSGAGGWKFSGEGCIITHAPNQLLLVIWVSWVTSVFMEFGLFKFKKHHGFSPQKSCQQLKNWDVFPWVPEQNSQLASLKSIFVSVRFRFFFFRGC